MTERGNRRDWRWRLQFCGRYCASCEQGDRGLYRNQRNAEALLLAEPEGYLRLFVDQGSHHSAAGARLPARRSAPCNVKAILAIMWPSSRPLLPAPRGRQNWLEPLKEQERASSALRWSPASPIREIADELDHSRMTDQGLHPPSTPNSASTVVEIAARACFSLQHD